MPEMSGSNANNASVVAPGGRLCRLDELADAASRPFWLTVDGGDAVEIFVVRQGDQVYSYVNSCPHHDRPLQWEGESFLTPDGGRILCQAHGATFDIVGGECLSGPARPNGCLTRVPLEVADGEIRLAPR
jgi:nitrite reductase/ring-hydroxylating ferredoxin subunit